MSYRAATFEKALTDINALAQKEMVDLAAYKRALSPIERRLLAALTLIQEQAATAIKRD